MLLSNTTEGLTAFMSDADAIQYMAKMGYDAYDMSFNYMQFKPEHPMNQENFREYALELRKIADEAGIVCNQAHAPMNNKCGEEEFDKTFMPMVLRSIEAAAILGAKIIIVHPIQCLPYAENYELLREMNIKFYKSLIPYCEKFGIKVAAENMWQWNRFTRQCIHSTCSRAEEFCDYIDSVGSEWIVACLDIGHVVLVAEDIPRMIRMLGHRLQALHIHDNDYKDDLHSFPYLFQIKFDQMTKALTEIGYKGDFTYEIGNVYARLPKEAWDSATHLLIDCGRYMMKQIG